MAENKEYMIHQEDDGSIQISEESGIENDFQTIFLCLHIGKQ